MRPSRSTRTSAAPAATATLLALLVAVGVGARLAVGSAAPPPPGEPLSAARVQQCREGCFEKFATKETQCQQNPECLTCWEECGKPPPPKINKSIRETWSLHTVTMLQQDSLVLVDVAWTPLSVPNQCLVTWEVSGGGLMGNLLTESSSVQLSLWPDTKYRVQVTCKSKLTGTMSRSLPLTIDTAEALSAQEHSAVATTPPPPVTEPIDESAAAAAAASSSSSSMEQEPAPVLPYEEQSAETLNQHTNFVFNWHNRNSDASAGSDVSAVSAVEPLHKPDLNLLSISALSDMQKPLLFGVIAGTFLLALVLLLYVCMVRQQRLPADKAALIADDVHAVVVSLPPAPDTPACPSSAACTRSALKV